MFHIRDLFVLPLVLSLGLVNAYVLNNTTTVEPSPGSSNITSTSTVIPDPNNDHICNIVGLAIIGGGAVAGGIIALIVVRLTICAMAFNPGGVAYESLGATWVSFNGTVRAEGYAANLRSCGTSGFGWCFGCVIWILGAALGGGFTYALAGCKETYTL